MPYGCVYAETYFTSGMGGRSMRASGLCGRRIGPLHPQLSTTAIASERITRRAGSFVVQRVILERSLGNDFVLHPPQRRHAGLASCLAKRRERTNSRSPLRKSSLRPFERRRLVAWPKPVKVGRLQYLRVVVAATCDASTAE